MVVSSGFDFNPVVHKYIIRWIRCKIYRKKIKLTGMVYGFEHLSGERVYASAITFQ